MTNDSITHHEHFLRLFTAHEPAIRAFVRNLVPLRADADDVLQEVAIVLWNRFEDFRHDGDFRAWAYGIARFKVLSWIRDRERDRIMLANDVVELIAADSEHMDMDLQRQRELLEHCFQKVSPRNRDLLLQAYQPQMTIQHVARSSGKTVAGFYQWLYRIRKMLQDCVDRELAREASL